MGLACGPSLTHIATGPHPSPYSVPNTWRNQCQPMAFPSNSACVRNKAYLTGHRTSYQSFLTSDCDCMKGPAHSRHSGNGCRITEESNFLGALVQRRH